MQQILDLLLNIARRTFLVPALILGFFALGQHSAFALQSVTLAWDASPDPTVTGYNVYYGSASGTYTNRLDVGNVTSVVISNLIQGVTYYFAVTAYNGAGLESDPSVEVSYTVPSASNQPPTLNTLGNLAINENAGQQTVNLSGITSGSPSESQTLTVTATSSNPGLIPTPTVNYTSPNTTGTLIFSPAANANGTANITVTVNDGGAQNNTISRMFTVTVNWINQPPTLNALGSLAINQNAGSQTVNLAGISSGAANESQVLSITATSSNPGLIPTPTVNYASPNTTGTLTLTPVVNARGSALITVIVNDGAAQNNTITRTLSVTVNQPPTVSVITDQIVAVSTATPAIPFTIRDAETAASGLVVYGGSDNSALVSSSGIVLGGSSTNRTVTITPLAGKTGTANIDIFVSDGLATNTTRFKLSVEGRPAAPANIRLTATSGGKILPDLTAEPLVVGKTYTVTAVPDADQEFTGWSGSISSSSPTLTFVPTNGFTLKASFAARHSSPVDGSYYGLFYEPDEVRQYSAGAFTVATTKNGLYSGSLQMGTKRYAFHGKFGLQSEAMNTIARRGTTALGVTLRLSGGDQATQITGTVSDGAWLAGLSGDRYLFNSRSHPTPLQGAYTLFLPNPNPNEAATPAGCSFGLLHVDPAGRVRLVASLADGTKLSVSGPLSQDGQWPLYAPLYTGQGSLVSWLTFTNRSTDDLNGQLSWIKPATPRTRFYASGFTNQYYAVGSSYVAPANGADKALSLTTARISFAGGNLPADFYNALARTSAGRLSNLSTNQLSLNFTLATGAFRGNVTDPCTGKSLPFNGAVFQKADTGYGFLLGSDQSSQVVLCK